MLTLLVLKRFRNTDFVHYGPENTDFFGYSGNNPVKYPTKTDKMDIQGDTLNPALNITEFDTADRVWLLRNDKTVFPDQNSVIPFFVILLWRSESGG